MRNSKGIANAITSKDGIDAFWTVDWATELLLKNYAFPRNILEPACGEGWISQVLQNNGYDVRSSDVNTWGYGEVKDFFDIDYWDGAIITNPPYKYALDFLKHALHLTPTVAMLLRIDFFTSTTRYDYLKNHPPKMILHIVNHLPIWHRDTKTFTHSGIMTHCWAIWDKDTKETIYRLVKK